MFREEVIEFILTDPDMEGGDRVWYDPKAGATRYGFSQKTYPEVKIEEITLEWAKNQAYVDYWKPCRCDDLPRRLAGAVFDFAFHSSANRAIRYLQSVLKVAVDGQIGAETILAAKHAKPTKTLAEYLALRAIFLSSQPDFNSYGKGWLKRLFLLQSFLSEYS